MDYDGQVSLIANYLKSGEKKKKDYTVGMELEHFIVEDDLSSVPYGGERGVGSLLKKIEKVGYEGIYDGENILGIKHPEFTITLEPGSQLEFSSMPSNKIATLESRYHIFEEIINDVMKDYGYRMVNYGYLPKNKIEDIVMIPKTRYNIMYEYFKQKGSLAHNMMKGTASLQIAIDYKSEKDFQKKFYVANALVPMIYALFDNAPIFEGTPYEDHAIRTLIWENTDCDRSGIVEGALGSSFTYEDYAEYILNAPAILTLEDGKIVSTGDKKVKEILDSDEAKEDEIDNILSMFFPDVRARKYIEIRSADSVPIEYALGLCAMCKGLFYHKENLNELYDFFRNISEFQIKEIKKDIIREGIRAEYAQYEIVELFDRIIIDARYGLDECEQDYLKPLDNLIRSETTLKERHG